MIGPSCKVYLRVSQSFQESQRNHFVQKQKGLNMIELPKIALKTIHHLLRFTILVGSCFESFFGFLVAPSHWQAVAILVIYVFDVLVAESARVLGDCNGMQHPTSNVSESYDSMINIILLSS